METRVLSSRTYQEARPRVLAHVERVRAACTLQELFDAQRSLIAEAWARQQTRADLREQAKEIGVEIRAAARANPLKARELQPTLQRVKLEEQVQHALHHVLRSIADGLAWKALRYDRLGVAILSRGRRVGRFGEGVGLETEFNWIEAYWSAGILALHNDLTNILRTGDLTLIRWPDRDLEADVVEVKATRDPDPSSAQFRRLEDARQFLRDGSHPTLAQGGPLAALRVPAHYVTHHRELAELISAARADGFAWREFSPGLAVLAAQLGRNQERDADQVHEEIKGALKWGERPFVWTSSQRRMRDRQSTIAEIAPTALFRLSADDVTDLLLGFLHTMTYLEPSILERELAERGIIATVARPPESGKRFLTARNEYGTFSVPAQVREQMMIELMTVDTLAESIRAAIRAHLTRKDGAQLVVVMDEGETWEETR